VLCVHNELVKRPVSSVAIVEPGNYSYVTRDVLQEPTYARKIELGYVAIQDSESILGEHRRNESAGALSERSTRLPDEVHGREAGMAIGKIGCIADHPANRNSATPFDHDVLAPYPAP
jgi:hypothetical protein